MRKWNTGRRQMCPRFWRRSGGYVCGVRSVDSASVVGSEAKQLPEWTDPGTTRPVLYSVDVTQPPVTSLPVVRASHRNLQHRHRLHAEASAVDKHLRQRERGCCGKRLRAGRRERLHEIFIPGFDRIMQHSTDSYQCEAGNYALLLTICRCINSRRLSLFVKFIINTKYVL